jgi:hypothetical protein
MDYGAELVSGAFMDAFTCFYSNSLGPVTMPLVVFAGVTLSIAAWTESVLVVVIISLFAGGLVMTQLPAGAVQLAVLVLVVVIAAGGYVVARRAEGAI